MSNAEREAPSYSVRADGYGQYDVLWPDGSVRMTGFRKEFDAWEAIHYFRSCDRYKAQHNDGSTEKNA